MDLSNNFMSQFSPNALGDFGDPFMLPSNEYFPDRADNIFDFCAYLFTINSAYRRVSERVVSHFITDIDFQGKTGDQRERKHFYSILRDSVQVFGAMKQLGMDWSAYGNGLAWLFFPFARNLVDNRDPTSPKEWALSNFEKYGEVKYISSSMEYDVVDPLTLHQPAASRPRVRFKFRDRWTLDLSKIRVVLLNPRHVTLEWAEFAMETRYTMRVPPKLVAAVNNNNLWTINRTPIGILRAISENKDFRFDDDQIFHLKSPYLTGVSEGAWGIPEPLLMYRELHQLQVYRKTDEAIGLDRMLPLRMFSPGVTKADTGETTINALLGEWEYQMEDLIRRKRRDPFAIHALPFPVTYQEFGGDGRQMSPKDLIEWQTNNMLDAAGYPAELFKGSMQVQQIPTAIRLFENAFMHLHRGFNNFLVWVARRIQSHALLETLEVSLRSPRVADNLEKQPIYMQLAAGGEFPRQLALRDVGVEDPVEAFRQRVREDIDFDKVRNEESRNYEREQQLGSMNDQVAQQNGGVGGMPASATAALSPLDIMSQAEEEAKRIVQLPGAQRRQEYQSIDSSNPNLGAMVRKKVKEYEAQAESQGRAQLQSGGGA